MATFKVLPPLEILNDLEISFDFYEGFDLALSRVGNDLATVEDLRNMVFLLLFVEGRAQPEDTDSGELSGWWGNELDTDPLYVSTLWTVLQSKIDTETPAKIETAVVSALKPLVDQGIVESVSCTAVRDGVSSVSWGIYLKRPKVDDKEFKFNAEWDATISVARVTEA